MTDIFCKIQEACQKNCEVALCIVTNTAGSTPRKKGAKMLVYQDGSIFGTIGGGRVEKQIIADAIAVLKKKSATSVHYNLLQDLQMCCGGSMDIYIEPIMQRNKLYIFGAGHTGVALAKRATDLDFDVAILDDRKEYTDAAIVPPATTICAKFKTILPTLTFDDHTYICIMTYSHPIDREILSFCINKPHAYIGMIGSRRKVEVTKRLFEEEGIATTEELDEIDMPMGIDIGADGPDEISVSILAKLLFVKNKQNAK